MSSILDELQRWQEKEEKLRFIVPESTLKSPKYLKAHLSFLNHIVVKYSGSRELRAEVGAIKAQAKELAREIYPSIARRIAFNLLKKFWVKRMEKKQQVKTSANIATIFTDLSRLGIDMNFKEVASQMKEKPASITLSSTTRVTTNERMSTAVNLRLQADGTYRIEGVVASLNNDETSSKVSCRFDAGGVILTAMDMHQVLAGRSIYRVDKGSWYQMDIHDKDNEGNMRLLSFAKNYGNDIEQEFERNLTLKNLSALEREEAIRTMERGERATVTIHKDGQERVIYLQYNPTFGVEIFNSRSGTESFKVPFLRIKKAEAHAPEVKLKNHMRIVR